MRTNSGFRFQECIGYSNNANRRGIRSSVTRFADFWKFFVTIFYKKVAQIFGDYLSNFEKGHSYVQTTVTTY